MIEGMTEVVTPTSYSITQGTFVDNSGYRDRMVSMATQFKPAGFQTSQKWRKPCRDECLTEGGANHARFKRIPCRMTRAGNCADRVTRESFRQVRSWSLMPPSRSSGARLDLAHVVTSLGTGSLEE